MINGPDDFSNLRFLITPCSHCDCCNIDDSLWSVHYELFSPDLSYKTDCVFSSEPMEPTVTLPVKTESEQSITAEDLIDPGEVLTKEKTASNCGTLSSLMELDNFTI